MAKLIVPVEFLKKLEARDKELEALRKELQELKEKQKKIEAFQEAFEEVKPHINNLLSYMWSDEESDCFGSMEDGLSREDFLENHWGGHIFSDHFHVEAFLQGWTEEDKKNKLWELYLEHHS